jgi:hypothetical protein
MLVHKLRNLCITDVKAENTIEKLGIPVLIPKLEEVDLKKPKKDQLEEKKHEEPKLDSLGEQARNLIILS